MKSINWDNPMSYEEFEGASWGGVFLYHEIEHYEAHIKKLMRHTQKSAYESYLSYCKIIASPLGQALL